MTRTNTITATMMITTTTATAGPTTVAILVSSPDGVVGVGVLEGSELSVEVGGIDD